MINRTFVLTNAARYSGIRGKPDKTMESRLEQALAKIEKSSHFRIVYAERKIRQDPEGIRILPENILLAGHTAALMLKGCDSVLLVAATLGFGVERATAKAGLFSMADALLMDAAASALLEEELDAWQKQTAAGYAPLHLTDRFSCGYGDLDLALQKPLSALLNMEQTLGIHLTDSLMMMPSKSVTALIGLSRQPQPARIRGCSCCSMQKTCTFRKGGKTCETI